MDAQRKKTQLSRRKKILFALVATVSPFLLLEVVLTLAGVDFGWEVDAPIAHEQLEGHVGSSPLWSDEELLEANFSIYRDDRLLLWRLRPDLSERVQNFLVPREFREERAFTVVTNGRGFRDPDAPAKGQARTVLCLGGSNTFGWGLDGSETWPAILAVRLDEEAQGRFAVRNWGQPGYSSRQGRNLWDRKGRDLDPAWVVLGFGFNDGIRAPLTDDRAVGNRAGIAGVLRYACARTRTYRLLRRVVLSLGGAGASGRLDLGPRVPRPAFRVNMETLITGVRKAGARPILLSVFCKYPEVLRELSEDLSVPLVDADRIAAELQAEFEAGGGETKARERIEASVPGAFLSEDPGWWVRADVAHYNGPVHDLIARALAAIILAPVEK